MPTRKKRRESATKGTTVAPAITPRTPTPAEYQWYLRGYQAGRRAGIKFERERLRGERGRLLRLPEVVRITGLSRATLWRLERRGLFPLRRQIGENAVGWFEGELQAWQSELPRQEDAAWLESLGPEERERARRGELGLFRIYEPTTPRPRSRGERR